MIKILILVLIINTYCDCQEISEELKKKLKEAICESTCINKTDNFKCTIPKCNCSTNVTVANDAGINFNRTYEKKLFEPKLLCKTHDMLTFEWKAKEGFVFVVEFRLYETTWMFLKKISCMSSTIRKLTPDTNYQIRLWAVSSNQDVFGPYQSKWIKTSPFQYKPLPVSKINVTDWRLIGNNYNALIKWEPPDDQNCFYNFLWYAPNSDDFYNFKEYEVRNREDLFQINIPHLEFGMNYSVSVRSVSGDFQRESEETFMHIVTPTCLEVYNNLTICEPLEPLILSIEETLSDDSDLTNLTYNVKIAWEKPLLSPDNYSVYIIPLNSSISDVYQNVPGNQTVCYFYNVPIDVIYQVAIMASSPGGNSTYAIIEKIIRSSPSWSNSNEILILTGSGVSIAIALLIVIVLLHRRYKLTKSKSITETPASNDYGSNIGGKFFPGLGKTLKDDCMSESINDEWELIDNQIVFDKILGEGAFGIVRKGYLKNFDGSEAIVAIKMLKGNPTGEEIKQFEHEIEIMKSVGPHPHLVSLLGCSSKLGYLGPFLVVEFCAKGDLQSYLRAVWERLVGQPSATRYINTPSIFEDIKVGNYFSNKIYILSDEPLLKPSDLLSFARQITMGMEYLSNLRVVHRDLAARNVLMCENGTVKVADFGLSRDVYQDNIYLKTGAGKLPVKWMALESLSHQQYTTQSDVWSFGVVLWEIVTLGGNPYATISPGDMLSVLRRGYRMECPKNCSDELYSIMQMCWRETPIERPNFNELRIMLEKLLEDENRYVTLDVRY
ncbi:hypothetical protein RN001_000393 [Aquatica leii]|uniref:receptor protein-tyrosine kinase n=1 Tax=Aquatica leii TaxID=1421715 RepID=A0AAN7Q720_9COLE|nr:hypothetical protein RN001_000393 [Aquatica leii]